MRGRLLAKLLSLLVLVWPALAVSETYYIHPSGLDARACNTASQGVGGCTGAASCARQTIRGGSSCLSAGDTLIIKAGTYTNQCLGDVDNADVDALPAGLSAGAQTTVRAATGETVLLRATTQCDGGTGVINMANNASQYITFDGFNITGNGTFQLITLGPAPPGSTKRITFRNMILSHSREAIAGAAQDCLFENITTRYSGLNEGFVDVCPTEVGCHGVYLQGSSDIITDPHTTGNVFRNLTSYGNYGNGIQLTCEGCGFMVHDNLIERSTFYDNKSSGVVVFPNNTVQNSVMYHNYVGITGYGNAYNNTVIGNTNTNVAGDPANLGIYMTGGAVVRNNISLGHPDGDILTQSGSPTYSNNLCGAIDSAVGCGLTATQATLFVNPGARNYHLNSGVVAINAGTTVSSVTLDMDGQARTAGQYDIGADEWFAGGSSAPVATITAPTSSPTYSTASNPLTTVAGTASDDAAVIQVTWICDVCGSGTAIGTTPWSIPSITLQPGPNVLTVRAHDAEAQIGPDTLTITLTGATPFAVRFLEQPTDTMVNQPITPAVTARIVDVTETTIPTSTAAVTIEIQQKPAACGAGCTLAGTLTKNAVAGIATFADLSINTVGIDYTLRLTSGTLEDDQSQFIAILAAPPPPVTGLAVPRSSGMFLAR